MVTVYAIVRSMLLRSKACCTKERLPVPSVTAYTAVYTARNVYKGRNDLPLASIYSLHRSNASTMFLFPISPLSLAFLFFSNISTTFQTFWRKKKKMLSKHFWWVSGGYAISYGLLCCTPLQNQGLQHFCKKGHCLPFSFFDKKN